MKLSLAIGLVVFSLISIHLYIYRQKMTRPISNQRKKELSYRTNYDYFTLGEKIELPYRLFIPDLKDSSEKLPLVLYLHGGEGRGNDNYSQLDIIVDLLTSDSFQNDFRSFVLVPQCPTQHQWVDMKNETRPYRNYSQSDISESVSLTMVRKVLAEIRAKYRIDNDRIYIIGFSMGATGGWDLITRYPKMFAAAILLNGRSDPAQASKICDLPLWVFHGKFDRVSPISNAREMIAQLKIFKSKVTYKELYWGHGIIRVALKRQESFQWLFKQRRSH